ncbi:MAG: lmo0937 family membrane protein [Planctomycetaceae bacterium]|nr:lmo0937 family membrane protein [Planctomycetaceae bacterium]
MRTDRNAPLSANGQFIHILLVIAVVVLLINLIQGRRVV